MTIKPNDPHSRDGEFLNSRANTNPVYSDKPTTAALIDYSSLPLGHFVIALFVAAIWGSNFVVIHQGLAEFPPLTFAALRFFFASVPLLLFVRWPRAPFSAVAGYGLLIGLGQFGLMLYAMNGHISPGMAAVLIQSQALFSVILAVIVAGEKVFWPTLVGLGLCGAGVVVIILHIDAETDVLGILLVLGAALSWGAANVLARSIGQINAIALVVWSNIFAVVPLVAAALAFEGIEKATDAITSASAAAWGTVFWQSFANALLGYGAWNWLLGRHPASRIAPLGLMVPIFGLATSAWYLGEPMPAWKYLAATFIMSGLAVNLLRIPRREA